ncbi:ABC transporter ATP-binding protein [Pseudomonas putida]|uniref:Spermidine/putrescine import ATP-binding protein PotA n=1 Tax=Pseudomonas putida TaxID=303 RepID=A0A7D5VVD4_PSEPU|nr:ABC transporter ATP-binding protein [Pseudomonas putida]QLJ12609.1 ABC transporter ATP-binding protein [Pseudomonas putida]
MSTKNIIEIVDAQKHFGPFQALYDINLSIKEGEIVTLLGPSGCGKTTLMRLIAGFEGVSSGAIRIDGVDMAGVAPEKRPVNMVFQRYALFPHLDVFDNVAFGLRVKGLSKAEVKERVNRMLEIVQLDQLSSRYIDELSGGQCQRVALARALVNGPKVLLLDEPLAALDLKIRQHMLAEMKRIHTETGATFVYVTHDQDEAMILSDRVVLMERGKIIQVDQPEDLYSKPRSLFAAKFLGETNLFEGDVIDCNGAGAVIKSRCGHTFTSSQPQPVVKSEKVFVSIRPESFTFEPNRVGEIAPLLGRVKDIVFTGSRSFYSIDLDSGSEVRVQVQRSATSKFPELGARASLFWEPESVVVVPMT